MKERVTRDGPPVGGLSQEDSNDAFSSSCRLVERVRELPSLRLHQRGGEATQSASRPQISDRRLLRNIAYLDPARLNVHKQTNKKNI